MASSPSHATVPPPRADTRWRHRFGILTVFCTALLIGMGGFVTSINAGLAVPDWPTSFGSMDPFRPMPEWWKITPVLAEHGHRLLGALIGLLTTILAVWTWRTDHRSWMRRLGFFALGLVIVQGILGGLRVVWISLDLAVVHACTAQLFFAIVLFMTIATSRTWLNEKYSFRRDDREEGGHLPLLSIVTAAALYGQIILGALLRHPGEGINTLLAYAHIGGAALVLALVVGVGVTIGRHFRDNPVLQLHRRLLYGFLGLQVTLGVVAYIVLLDETGRLVEPSILQVTVNTSHLVVGSLLFATAVSLALWLMRQPIRRRLCVPAHDHTADSTHSPHTQLA